jgi:hypothetical protein
MAAVKAFADRGGPVLGICNGFQVLLEAGLLPGRDAPQPRPQVPVRARVPCASSRPTRRSRRRAGRARCCACRSRTARATTSPSRRRRRARGGRQVIFRYTTRRASEVDRRGQPERIGQQHRRHLQRGAQRRRADAASRARLRAALGSADGLAVEQRAMESGRSDGSACCCRQRHGVRVGGSAAKVPVDRRRASCSTCRPGGSAPFRRSSAVFLLMRS